MNPQFSIYLHLIRFGAALTVLLAHLAERHFQAIPLPFPGKDAVVAFFVLSGFVVAYVADVKERTAFDYGISRFSRIVSVFIPALALSAAIAMVEIAQAGGGTGAYARLMLTLAANLTLTGQSWGLDLTPPHNNAAWSIIYEGWYYVLFGVWCFVRGWIRWPALLLLGALAGPNVLLLLPIWLAGIALYHWRDRFAFPPDVANRIFAASLVLYAAYFLFDVNVGIRAVLFDLAPETMGTLHYSNRFAGDYLLAAIVFVNFAAARRMANPLTAALLRHRTPIAWLAGHTLSVYLYHLPLIYLFGTALTLAGAGRGPASGLAVLALLGPSLYGLALVTERRLGRLRGAIHAILSKPATTTRARDDTPTKPVSIIRSR